MASASGPSIVDVTDSLVEFEKESGHVTTVTTPNAHNIDDDDRDNYDDDDEDDDDEGDVHERLHDFSDGYTATSNSYGDNGGRQSGRHGARPMFVHSYSVPTTALRSWANRMFATTNIDMLLRSTSLLHLSCSLLLVLMGTVGILAKSFSSYVAIPIWCPVLVYIPTSISGFRSRKQLRNRNMSRMVRQLAVLSGLSATLSFIFVFVYISFVHFEGQLKISCMPTPYVTTDYYCKETAHRVLINALDVLLFLIELLTSLVSLVVCYVLRVGDTRAASDSEKLISESSMSYKRLSKETSLDYADDLSHPLTANDSYAGRSMNGRSISAPAIVGVRIAEE